jgi:hypothetical protein
MRGLGRRQLQALFARVQGFGELTLDDLVPQGQVPFEPVRHIGHNSLPLFSNFEKRFYRLGDAAAIGGANFQSTSILTGPGYFLARRSESAAEVIIDYRTLPKRAPAGWPKIRDNDHGPAALVYGGAVDTLRRVARHVSIGEARRNDGPAEAYFVLCRQV